MRKLKKNSKSFKHGQPKDSSCLTGFEANKRKYGKKSESMKRYARPLLLIIHLQSVSVHYHHGMVSSLSHRCDCVNFVVARDALSAEHIIRNGCLLRMVFGSAWNAQVNIVDSVFTCRSFVL